MINNISAESRIQVQNDIPKRSDSCPSFHGRFRSSEAEELSRAGLAAYPGLGPSTYATTKLLGLAATIGALLLGGYVLDKNTGNSSVDSAQSNAENVIKTN